MDYSGLFDTNDNKKMGSDGFDFSNITVTTGVVEHEPVIPEYQGDYAKAVFLWSHAKGSHRIGNDCFPRYIIYECGIEKPEEFQKKMISEGYLEEDAMAVALESLSGVQLKEIATELGVATSGKKSKVVERILGAANMDYLYKISPRTCSLTEKGKAFVKEHDDYVQLHRHNIFGIGWEEYDEVKHAYPQLRFCEVAEKILLQKAAADDMYLGSLQYHCLSDLFYEYNNPQKATRYLLQRMYLYINGVSKWRWIRSYLEYGYEDKSYFNDDFYFGEFFSSKDAETLMLHRDYYSTEIVDRLYTWKLPIQLCEQSLFEEMIETFLDGNFDQAKYEELIRDRYYGFIKSL